MGTISIGFGISNGEGVSLALDGSYGIGFGDIVEGVGELLPAWTPNFNAVNSYGDLTTTFTPTGAGTVLSVNGVYKTNAAIQQLLSPELSAFALTVSATNVISFNLLANVTINGLVATSGVTVLADGYFELVGDLDATADIDIIAANAAFAENFQTQLHLISAIDPLDANNSIEIDTVISSATMPTETNLYNKLAPALGSEKVVNGDFSDGVNDWTVGAAIASVVDGAVNIDRNGAAAGNCFYQSIPTSAGKAHKVSYDLIDSGPFSAFKLRVTNSIPSGAILADVDTGFIGVNEVEFTAVSTVSFIHLIPTGASTNTGIVDNVSIKQTNQIGTLVNLGATAYGPQIKGGAQDRSFEVLKSEQYLGDYSVGDFDNGVDTIGAQITSLGTATGSMVMTGRELDIVVGLNGAVIKISTVVDANTADYTVLLGTEAQIKAGVTYPNVIRVLEPDATVGSEYKWLNDGNPYPWVP